MMKYDINKIINETEFLILKKGGGWPGYNFFVRHKIWSKYTGSIIKERKPRLTKKLKKTLVEMALKNKIAKKDHDENKYKLDSINYKINNLGDDINYLICAHKHVFNIIIRSLEENCEIPEVNETMQRLLDLECEVIEWTEIKNRLTPYPSRTIT